MSERGDTRLVYSTAGDNLCARCGRSVAVCRCHALRPDEPVPAKLVAKLRLEKKGRGGKTVSVVYDLPRNESFLKELCQELKRACGTGGTVHEDTIELQGDLRDRIRACLTKRGISVKG